MRAMTQHSNELTTEELVAMLQNVPRSPRRKVKTTSSNSFGTLITDIPEKVLISIFKLLDEETAQILRRVCRQWNRLISNEVPVEIWATDIGFRFSTRYFYDVTYFSNFVIENLHSRVQTEKYPQLRAPEKLKFLEFAVPTSLSLFNQFIDHAINLTSLTFGNGALTEAVLSASQLIHFPKLKIFRINDLSLKSNDVERPETLFQNIIAFLHMHFVALETFTLCTVASKPQALRYTLHMFTFMQKHWRTLKCAALHLHISLHEFPVREVGDGDESSSLQWRHKIMGELTDVQINSLDWELLSRMHLQEIEVDYGVEFFCALPEWIRFLRQQKHVKHLNFAVGYPLIVPSAVGCWQANPSALVTLQLGVSTYTPEDDSIRTLDCHMFKELCNLKMLCLVGEANFPSKQRPKRPELLYVEKLPESISALAIENIHIDSNDLYIMLSRLRHLDRLSLQMIGSENNLGLKLPLLEMIVESKRLREMMIRGVNGDDCSLHQYETLMSLGLTIPLRTFFCHLRWNDEERRYTVSHEF